LLKVLHILFSNVRLATNVGHCAFRFHTEQATQVAKTVFARVMRSSADLWAESVVKASEALAHLFDFIEGQAPLKKFGYRYSCCFQYCFSH